MKGQDFIDLQKRADDLAATLDSDGRLLIHDLCRELREQRARLDTIARTVRHD